jgi:murein DD-endopeptidase MepM/ murein hydrolase activator NlpD
MSSSSPEEMQELQETAEHGRESRLAPVSLTMAILAVFVAAVSVLGHRAHTEEIILQNRVTDTWAYYQAKNSQRQTNELFLDLLKVSELKHPEVETLKRKYQDAIGAYSAKQEELKAEGRKLEKEMEVERRRADRFDLGESFLEIALVVTSITLLTRKRIFWGAGFVAAAIGLIIAVTGLLLH